MKIDETRDVHGVYEQLAKANIISVSVQSCGLML